MLVGIIPAAGRALRLGPQPASKEVLPVRGRPVMDHLVERLREAAPDELRVVTRPEKEDVIEHARALGATVVLGDPAHVGASLALGLAGLAPTDEVLFGFPDTLWEPRDGFVRVLGALRAGADVALGLFRTEELQRSDVVRLGPGGAVLEIAVKPARPAGELIWGCAATRAEVLAGLARVPEPGVLFDDLVRRGRPVQGVRLSAEWLDIGTPDALRRARS